MNWAPWERTTGAYPKFFKSLDVFAAAAESMGPFTCTAKVPGGGGDGSWDAADGDGLGGGVPVAWRVVTASGVDDGDADSLAGAPADGDVLDGLGLVDGNNVGGGVAKAGPGMGSAVPVSSGDGAEGRAAPIFLAKNPDSTIQWPMKFPRSREPHNTTKNAARTFHQK